MRLARSTYYYRGRRQAAEKKVLCDRIEALCAEFPRDGYRRITHRLRAEGMVVNHKAVARLMRQNGLQVRPLRKFVRTTDSDHDGPIFPNLARGFRPTGPYQLWVGDITYIRIVSGFVYLAVILDAWSRRVIGYALGRQIDTRLCIGSFAGGNRDATTTARLYPSFRSRCAVRGRALSPDTCRTRIGRFDESARQSIRQRESREFHEDDQVRRGLPQ